MFDYLPQNVKIIRDRCWSTETIGGFLRCLPKLFDVASKEAQTKDQFAQLKILLNADAAEQKKLCEKAVEWMKSCLSKLKNSPFANHPLCVAELKRAEDLLIHRKLKSKQSVVSSELSLKLIGSSGKASYNPLDRTWGFVDAAKEALMEAVNAIASFGPDPLFDGWAKIETRREHTCGVVPQFPDNISGEVLMGINQQGELAEKLRSGVYCWEVVQGFLIKKI